MRVLLILIVIFLGLQSCTENEPEAPSPIAFEELVPLLADALLLEPGIKELPLRGRDSLAQIYYAKMLEETPYSLDQYKDALRWMQKDPKRLQEIYSKVMEELADRENKKDDKKAK